MKRESVSILYGLIAVLVAGCATTTQTGVPSALHVAAGKGKIHEVGRLLIVMNPNTRYTTADYSADRDLHGTTPIHWAVKNHHLATVELLVQEGANPDARDARGWTALHYAASEGHPDTVKRLIELGADPLIADDEGWTPLHHAAKEGHPVTTRTLLEMGSGPYLLTDLGQSPIDLARQHEHPQTAYVIEEHTKTHAMPGVTVDVTAPKRKPFRRLLFWHGF